MTLAATLEALQAMGGVGTARDVAEETGTTAQIASTYLGRLAEAGAVTQDGTWPRQPGEPGRPRARWRVAG